MHQKISAFSLITIPTSGQRSLIFLQNRNVFHKYQAWRRLRTIRSFSIHISCRAMAFYPVRGPAQPPLPTFNATSINDTLHSKEGFELNQMRLRALHEVDNAKFS